MIVESKLIREHTIGKIAERTIGYEKPDPAGNFLRVGLEVAFSQYLKGENGRRLKQKKVMGTGLFVDGNVTVYLAKRLTRLRQVVNTAVQPLKRSNNKVM